MEGARKRSAERLLNVGRVVGILRNSKNTDERANTRGLGNNVRRKQKASKFKEKTLNGTRKNTKKQFRTIERKKAVKWRRKTLKKHQKLKTPQPLHTVKLRAHVKAHT